MTTKNKHLSLENRQLIEELLNEGKSFKEIGRATCKDCTTISKEIKKNYQTIYPSKFNGRNTCILKMECEHSNYCNAKCDKYQPDICEKLFKPPYVCNGCDNRKHCRKIKRIYKSTEANDLYRNNLVESRQGINITEEEKNELEKIVTKAIKKGHSPALILMNNPTIEQSEKTIYNYIEGGVFKDIGNIDLPRKVKYKKRIKHTKTVATNRECRIGRTYNDFTNYILEHPNDSIVEMDTVEGIKGGKCMLTLLFRNSNFMISFLLETQTQEQVTEKLTYLKNLWGKKFLIDFSIILTDNGSEFLDADAIEFFDKDKKIKLFYCDPGASNQKGRLEKNHEYIRYYLPKGTSFDNLTQNDVNLLMSHINSVPRKELNCTSPYDLALLIIGEKILLLNYQKISGNDIILKSYLLKK